MQKNAEEHLLMIIIANSFRDLEEMITFASDDES